jgi:hypothetical protein
LVESSSTTLQLGKQAQLALYQAKSQEETCMEMKIVMVPKSLIMRHYPHPEFYGESIVELENGMTTDVFTDEEAMLYTQTNDLDLIDYLANSTTKDEPRLLSSHGITLTSLSIQDMNQIQEWFRISPMYRYEIIDECQDIIKQYISHTKTQLSDALMITSDYKNIGVIGFTVIDTIAILHCEIYHDIVSTSIIDKIIMMMKDYLLRSYRIRKMLFPVFDFDYTIMESLKRSEFLRSDRDIIQIPTLTGHLYQIEYEWINNEMLQTL